VALGTKREEAGGAAQAHQEVRRRFEGQHEECSTEKDRKVTEDEKPPSCVVEDSDEPPIKEETCDKAQLYQSDTDRVSVGVGVSLLSWCKELLAGRHLCYHHPGVGLRHKLPVLVLDRIVFQTKG
jgi:hypothetical protein